MVQADLTIAAMSFLGAFHTAAILGETVRSACRTFDIRTIHYAFMITADQGLLAMCIADAGKTSAVLAVTAVADQGVGAVPVASATRHAAQ